MSRVMIPNHSPGTAHALVVTWHGLHLLGYRNLSLWFNVQVICTLWDLCLSGVPAQQSRITPTGPGLAWYDPAN